MKYEMIFGDEKLFDGAPDDAEMAYETANHVRVYYKKCNSLKFFSNTKWVRVLNEKAMIIHAMRRIISTPRWMVADQNAGKLPEVGCRVNFCHKLNTNWRTGEVKYIDDQVAVIKADDIDRPFVYEVDRVEFKPIESQEEKAARLREEWVDKATFMTTYEIYDQLLSGDLPVPVKE